jgi:hypothetical protein
MTQLEIAQAHEIKKLKEKISLMNQLATKEAFYKYYFSKLNQYPSNKSCFDAVNELYLQLFGMYRYSDYNSFRRFNNLNLIK